MKKASKITALIMAIIIAVSCSGIASYAVSTSDAVTITGLTIVTKPTKKNYFYVNDWKYGYWSFPESGAATFVARDSLISLMYNGGKHHYYEDRGMIDLNGLVVKVTYSDGSSADVKYSEVLSGTTVSPNMLSSPSKTYAIGTNSIEVYFKSNPKAYATFDVDFLKYQLGDVNMDGKINSFDGLCVLQHVVGLSELSSEQQLYANVNGDKTINSSDALNILRIVVGLEG